MFATFSSIFVHFSQTNTLKYGDIECSVAHASHAGDYYQQTLCLTNLLLKSRPQNTSELFRRLVAMEAHDITGMIDVIIDKFIKKIIGTL